MDIVQSTGNHKNWTHFCCHLNADDLRVAAAGLLIILKFYDINIHALDQSCTLYIRKDIISVIILLLLGDDVDSTCCYLLNKTMRETFPSLHNCC